MKKISLILVLLLTGCDLNNNFSDSVNSVSSNIFSNSSTSSSSSINNMIIENFAYVHHFEKSIDGYRHYEYFTNGRSNNIDSLSVAKSEIDRSYPIKLSEYGITNLVGGDTIELYYVGQMWVTSSYPSGYATIMGEFFDLKYYPSEIYEVTLTKEIIEGDQIHIGFDSSFENLKIENYYVISKDENDNFIHRQLDEYDNNTTLYYSFNTKMNEPHKYSFLYDFKIR